MDSRNDRIRDFLGVTAWHKAGYTGKGGVAVLGEDFPHAQKWEHAYQTWAVFKEIAPDCDVVYVPMEFGRTPPVDNLFVDFVVPEVEKIRPNTVGVSLAYNTRFDGLDEALEPLMDYCTWMLPVGNQDMGFPVNLLTECKNIYGVGACTLMVDGTLTPAYYSVETQHIDICSLANFNIDGHPLSGTSFAGPAAQAQMQLVEQLIYEKTGKHLSAQGAYMFWEDYAQDIWTPGKDTKTGLGILILPPPETVDAYRYVGGNIVEYKDKDKISSWAVNAVEAITKAGLMKGDDNGNFNPKANITREEVAVILHRLLEAKR